MIAVEAGIVLLNTANGVLRIDTRAPAALISTQSFGEHGSLSQFFVQQEELRAFAKHLLEQLS